MVAKMQLRSDDDIRDSVLLELEWDPKITSNDIAVAVKDGVVTLRGARFDAVVKAATRPRHFHPMSVSLRMFPSSGQVCLYNQDQSATHKDAGKAKLLSLKNDALR